MSQIVYITQYALTKGIYEKEVTIHKEIHSDKSYAMDNDQRCYFGKDYHLTKESALEDAEIRKITKMYVLKNQIERLKQMKFS